MMPEDRVRAAVAELADALLAVARESAAPRRDTAPVELLSVAEFARRAGIGRSSAYLAVADGSVRSVRLRGRRLLPASEITRLAESAGLNALEASVTKRPARVSETSRTGQGARRAHGRRPTAA
jgi:GNAT superfamily N-acetyltransferase